MKIWVTGALGFVGRQVTQHALAAGYEVFLVVRRGPPDTLQPEPRLESDSHLPNAKLTRADSTFTIDLRDSDQVTALVQRTEPDAVIHLAWYAKPQDYLTSAENVDSLESTLSFARALLKGGCRRMLGVGTCLEYADLTGPRLETDPVDPKSLYARCKHAAHLVVAELFRQSDASLAWARLFHMHGPGEHPSRLIPSLAAALRAGRPFPLSPGEQVRDHLDVRDVGSALLHIAAHPELEGAVNVCSGKPVTLRTVLETVGRELGHPELLEFGKRAYVAGEVMNLAGVPSRLVESGWRPAHGDLAASIRDALKG